jgi:hypothetical protein
VQAAVVGLNSFNGAGNCYITARLNAGLSVQSFTTSECSYTVNSNGTGSINIVGSSAESVGSFRFR